MMSDTINGRQLSQTSGQRQEKQRHGQACTSSCAGNSGAGGVRVSVARCAHPPLLCAASCVDALALSAPPFAVPFALLRSDRQHSTQQYTQHDMAYDHAFIRIVLLRYASDGMRYRRQRPLSGSAFRFRCAHRKARRGVRGNSGPPSRSRSPRDVTCDDAVYSDGERQSARQGGHGQPRQQSRESEPRADDAAVCAWSTELCCEGSCGRWMAVVVKASRAPVRALRHPLRTQPRPVRCRCASRPRATALALLVRIRRTPPQQKPCTGPVAIPPLPPLNLTRAPTKRKMPRPWISRPSPPRHSRHRRNERGHCRVVHRM